MKERYKPMGKKISTEQNIAEQIISVVCSDYVNPLFAGNCHEAFCEFRDFLLYKINQGIIEANSIGNGPRIKTITKLEPYMVKEIIFGFYVAVNFAYSNEDKISGVLMLQSRDEKHDRLGKFELAENILETFKAELLSSDAKTRGLLSSIMFDSRTMVHITDPIVEDQNEYIRNATPCNNGIYIPEEYAKTGRLLTYREACREPYYLYVPFSFAADYLGQNNPAPNLSNPKHGMFNPKEWLKQMYANTPEKEEQMMAVNLAIFRPFNMEDYKEGIFLEDRGEGHTGKSTLTTMIRAAVGNGHYLSVNLATLSNGGFEIQNMANPGKCLIISDENEPSDFLKNLTIYKRACTGEPISINRKFGAPVDRVFRGRIVQCFNGIVKASDNTGSASRRFYPMLFSTIVDKGDGNGGIPDNREIKGYWMKQQDVINWFLTEAINRNVCPLPKTEEMLALRDEIEEKNNPVLRFFREYVTTMRQNWFELKDLYPAYLAFCKSEGHANAANTSSASFETEATRVLKRSDSGWTYKQESNEHPEKIGSKNVNQFHVPIAYLTQYGLRDDEVYKSLRQLADPTMIRDPHNKQANEAIRHLYSNTKPGTKRNAYYRNERTEVESLIDLASVLVIGGVDGIELSTDKVVQNLFDYMEYSQLVTNPFDDPLKEVEIKLDQADFTTCIAKGITPDKKTLWDFIVNRLNKLGVQAVSTVVTEGDDNNV